MGGLGAELSDGLLFDWIVGGCFVYSGFGRVDWSGELRQKGKRIGGGGGRGGGIGCEPCPNLITLNPKPQPLNPNPRDLGFKI